MNPIGTVLTHYPKSLVESQNCSKNYSDVKIVLLLLRHLPQDVEVQNFYNQYVVESVCNQSFFQSVFGDKKKYSIYVEENKELKNDMLEAAKIFNSKKYKLKGWDDPESCNKGVEIAKELHRALELINKFSDPHSLNAEENSDLQNFASKNSIPIPIQSEIENNAPILKTFRTRCLRAIFDIKENYIKQTFPKRQKILINKILKCLKISDRLFFFLVGERHVITKNNYKYGKEAIKLKNSLTKEPYLILNSHLEQEAIRKSLLPPPPFRLKNFLPYTFPFSTKSLDLKRTTNCFRSFLSHYLPSFNITALSEKSLQTTFSILNNVECPAVVRKTANYCRDFLSYYSPFLNIAVLPPPLLPQASLLSNPSIALNSAESTQMAEKTANYFSRLFSLSSFFK